MRRREFLAGAAVMAGAAALGRPADGSAQLSASPCPVTLLPMPDYGRDMEREIAQVMVADGLVLKGKRVLLKPNFVEAHPERPINTNPAVIASVAHACLRLGASDVAVGEASGHRRDPWFSVLNPGLRSVLDKRVRCLDLNHGEAVAMPNRGGSSGLAKFYLARAVAEADVLISLPKMKTHHWMGVTLCLKNLFGTLPGIYYGWPKNLLHFRGIENSVLDLARTVRVHYNVIDGVVGMEGDGPIMGRAKPVGALVLSPFSLAADATAARLMGFEPRRILYLVMAARFLPGLRPEDVALRGEDPRRLATRFDCLDAFKPMRGGPFF
ncbi:MAG TPA: DUF362 domain-containing protein [Terriglobales bacterium]|nr:DUF362 domain-containing protein [Terriglobales bacterium]